MTIKAALLVAAAFVGGPAFAQSTAPVSASGAVGGSAQATQTDGSQAAGDGTQVADIVVTAQKRTSTAQNTPLAITAVGGADLSTRQVSDIQSLAPSLPNVNFGRNVGFARIAIRGLGLDTTVAGQEGRVAYHTDGVYISRPTAQLATFFDINRVEVVRGPQGTLYGRNATAGAINVITNDPTDVMEGYAKLTGGNYGLFSAEGAISGPVSDTLSARFAFQATRRDGFGRDVTNGEDIDNERRFGVRGKIKFRPSDRFTLVLSADYSYENDRANVYHYIGAGKSGVTPVGLALGGTVPANPRDTAGNVPQLNEQRFAGFSAVADYDLGFATLTSITGYRDSKTSLQTDADGTAMAVGGFEINERAHQVSEELRLNGDIGPVQWIVGGYYFNEHIFGQTRISPLRSPITRGQVMGADVQGNFDTDAYAFFGQIDYKIVDGIKLSAGVRYSSEEKRVNQFSAFDLFTPYAPTTNFTYTRFMNQGKRFSSTTPRFGIEYKPSHNVLIYATYAKGFKSGGYSLGTFGAPLNPEKLTDYEGGVKTQWLNNHLQLNLAGFYYDYRDLQVQKLLGTTAILVNAASARVKGIEAEVVVRPATGLELSGNISWLDAKFTNFVTSDPARLELGDLDLSGNRLQQAPEFTGNATIQYRFRTTAGNVTLRGEATYSDRVFFSPFNRIDVSQGAYVKGNLFATLDLNHGISVSAFVRNIADLRTVSSSQISSSLFGFPIMGAYDPPRTFGGSVGIRF